MATPTKLGGMFTTQMMQKHLLKKCQIRSFEIWVNIAGVSMRTHEPWHFTNFRDILKKIRGLPAETLMS